MGIDLIEWTSDPLSGRSTRISTSTSSACVVEEYEENVYGESSSPLHGGAPTDRFVAEWRLTTPHVERRIGASTPANAATRRRAIRADQRQGQCRRRSRPGEPFDAGPLDRSSPATPTSTSKPRACSSRSRPASPSCSTDRSGPRARVAAENARHLPVLLRPRIPRRRLLPRARAGRGQYLLARAALRLASTRRFIGSLRGGFAQVSRPDQT